MKSLLMAFAIALAPLACVYGHDEGHGPQLSDAGKYGGLVTAVVDRKEHGKGAHAHLVYKAELVRSTEGKVRVYLYDSSMKPLDLTKPELKIDKAAKGELHAKVKGKLKTEKFTLKLEGNSFVGDAPKAPGKPYTLDIQFKEEKRDLLAAFDNLD